MADEYDVGYGKPPRSTQFVKGKSGNPKGRRKGSKNLATVFSEVTRELIHVKENGVSKTVTKIEAIMRQMTSKAMSGDLRAMKEILHWHQLFESMSEKQSLGSPDEEKDQAVMNFFIRTIRAERPVDDSAVNELQEESSHEDKDA